MKTPSNLKLLLLGILFGFTFISFKSYAQQYNLNSSVSELKVFGTSNLHDWHITTEEQKGMIALGETDELTIEKLKIDAVSESLKSGKKGMDKNTYKALKTEEFKTITFQLTEIKKMSKVDVSNYKVEASGNLTLSGVTKKISLNFTLNKANGEIHLTGEKKLKMTEFNIDPPTALLGTITTGDEVTIKFNSIFKK